MLFSYRWLGEYVELPADAGVVAERLTFAGFTVESIRTWQPTPGGADGAGSTGLAGGAETAVADPDTVFDVDVTTNRPDCMNHFGLARELAVLFDHPLAPPPAIPLDPIEALEIVEVDDPAGCPRCTALVVEGVRVAPSPPWLVRHLASIGLRSINNVVDVTNFVLWETGQPLHAYDRDRLEGGRIRVRRGRPGERLTTLDGVEREIDAATLVIADAARPVGLAGVMGGLASEVTVETRRLLLESACFERTLVRRTAKRLGMHTDASHRFERGIDLEGCLAAAARAAALIVEVAGGTVLPGAADVRAAVPPGSRRRAGRLVLARLDAFAGASVAAADVERWLRGLGFGVRPLGEAAAAPAWEVTVPSWRWFDFEPGPGGEVYEADLFEEVLRIYGLDRIPAALPAVAGSDGPRTERQRVRDRTKGYLAGAGYAETINFAFEDPAVTAALPTLRPGLAPLRLANPLSENLSVMRRSLLGNLLGSARFNLRHGAAAVRLFEVGTVFFPRGAEAPDEEEHVALLCGGRVGLPWDREVALDLFDLKGEIEALAGSLGVRLTARAAELPGMLAGSAAELLDGAGRVVGLLGRLEAEEAYPLYAGEIALAALEGGARMQELDLPPRVPGIHADLTLTHALAVSWRELAAAIEARRPAELAEFALKNRYQGEGVPHGAVNTTVTFHYNAGDRSLTQDEVNERQQDLASDLTRRFGWQS